MIKYWMGAALLLASVLAFAQETPAKNPSARWETEIKAFEKADQDSFPPKGVVEFVGSSSIRMWKDLDTAFLPRKVINRGFGGSQIKDSTFFANRIIIPYQPRMVVLYAGDNDIAAGETPDEVFSDFKQFAQTVREKLPETKIAFLSIKPSPSRWQFISQIREANAKIKDYIRHQKRMVYIDVFTPMLDTEGQPKPEYYKPDRLHPTPEAYALWRKVIAPYLK